MKAKLPTLLSALPDRYAVARVESAGAARFEESRMQQPPQPVLIRAHLRPVRLDFELTQGLQQCASVHQASAIAAIEIFSPGIFTGSLAPCRAGGLDGNHLSHSSFMP